jgi:hypothetical protein
MKKPKLQPPLTVDVSVWKTAESIPTEEAIPFDYGAPALFASQH